jgi:hypothetical protein
MKKISFIVFTSLLVAGNLFAQREETLFDRNGLSGIWGSVTFNYSYFDEDWALVRGGNIGLEFGNSVFVGYSWNRFKDYAVVEDANNDFRMNYKGVIIGVSPRPEKVVHPRISFFTGGGRVYPEFGSRDNVFVFQPSGGLEVNVFRWFRIGMEGGYRFVTNSDISGLKNRDLSSPFAQLDLRFGISWD